MKRFAVHDLEQLLSELNFLGLFISSFALVLAFLVGLVGLFAVGAVVGI